MDVIEKVSVLYLILVVGDLILSSSKVDLASTVDGLCILNCSWQSWSCRPLRGPWKQCIDISGGVHDSYF